MILAGGVAALLCMTRTRRPASEPADFNPAQPSFSKLNLHRASRLIEARVPQKLNELKSLAEDNPSGGIEALEEFLAAANEQELEFLWFAHEPAAAARWIESLPDGPLRNGIIERVLSEFAHHNATGAITVAESLTAPELRDAALTSVLRRWASDSPVEALGAIASREEWRDSALAGRAFVAAATSSPRQIKELFAILPAGSLDNSFLATATESLLTKDPGALPLWFESVQTAEQRSTIAETVMLHAGRNQPEFAFIWATQISEPAQRTGALQGLLHKTTQRNPVAAPALFNSPWLSTGDRDNLLNWFAEQATASNPAK
jgi:hypothetical protein